jgi:hypothetical protein
LLGTLEFLFQVLWWSTSRFTHSGLALLLQISIWKFERLFQLAFSRGQVCFQPSNLSKPTNQIFPLKGCQL